MPVFECGDTDGYITQESEAEGFWEQPGLLLHGFVTKQQNAKDCI